MGPRIVMDEYGTVIGGKIVCTHGASEFNDYYPMSLMTTHSWFRAIMRCWYCDLKEDLGPRRYVRTHGDGLAIWRSRHECAYGGPKGPGCWNPGACGCDCND